MARPNQPDQIGKTESTVPGLNTPLVCAPSQHTPLLHNSWRSGTQDQELRVHQAYQQRAVRPMLSHNQGEIVSMAHSRQRGLLLIRIRVLLYFPGVILHAGSALKCDFLTSCMCLLEIPTIWRKACTFTATNKPMKIIMQTEQGLVTSQNITTGWNFPFSSLHSWKIYLMPEWKARWCEGWLTAAGPLFEVNVLVTNSNQLLQIVTLCHDNDTPLWYWAITMDGTPPKIYGWLRPGIYPTTMATFRHWC